MTNRKTNKSKGGGGCFSTVKLLDKFYFSNIFTRSGLRHISTELNDDDDDGTTIIHMWSPVHPSPTKPNLVLLHGFGANTKWQFSKTISTLTPFFNLYLPDLVFFGYSHTSLPDRTDAFQADCVIKTLEKHGINSISAVVGLSYGGFVAYSMASRWKEKVERVVICCCGICVEEKDMREGMFVVREVDQAAEVLTPQTKDKMREMIGYVAYDKPMCVPDCFLNDFIDVMCSEYIEERRDLLRAILKDRKISEIPKITQPTLIMWGDQDQIFPIECAHRLKRHLGDNAELKIFENAGHMFNAERSKEFNKHLLAFLRSPPADPVGNPPPPVDLKAANNGAAAVLTDIKTTDHLQPAS